MYKEYLPFTSKVHQPSVRARIKGLFGPEILVLLKVYFSVKYDYKLITSITSPMHIYSMYLFLTYNEMLFI